jgi:polygalacturonase
VKSVGKNRRQFMSAVGGGATAGLQNFLPLGLAQAATSGHGTGPGHRGPGEASGITGLFDVVRFGAVGNGTTASTAGLQRALDAAGDAGGGLVFVPPGTYLTGALSLRSHCVLFLAAGATLRASQNPGDFPPMKGRDEGLERTIHAALLTGVDLQDVAVTGHGVLDGQGEPWWKADEEVRKLRVTRKLPREAENPENAPLRWPRPRVINLIRCRNATIAGITLQDGPSPNIHLLYCEGVLVEGVTIQQARPARGTDGIIVDSSKRVRIVNCALSSGADCVAIKSGYNQDGRRVGIASEDIVITGCHMHHTIGSGVAIGSETSGSVRNVVVSDCVMQDCNSGIFIRAPRGRGGVVENVRAANIVMDAITEQAIKISHFFDSIRMEGRFGFKPTFARSNVETVRGRRAPVDEGTPSFHDFDFTGFRIGRTRDIATIEGLPERFVHGIALDGFTVTQAKTGITCDMVDDLRISDVTVGKLETPAVDARDINRLEIHRLRCGQPEPTLPAVWLENVNGAFIHGCDVATPPGATYAWLGQEQSKDVVQMGNKLPVTPHQPQPPVK